MSDLVYPLQSVLDDSIGCAIWFAARGQGHLVTSEGPPNHLATNKGQVAESSGDDIECSGNVARLSDQERSRSLVNDIVSRNQMSSAGPKECQDRDCDVASKVYTSPAKVSFSESNLFFSTIEEFRAKISVCTKNLTLSYRIWFGHQLGLMDATWSTTRELYVCITDIERR